MFAQHLLLTKIVAEATAQDWSVIDLVARSYQPRTDGESELDWLALADSLGDTLSFQRTPPAVAQDDPNWLRKPRAPKEEFPEINFNAT